MNFVLAPSSLSTSATSLLSDLHMLFPKVRVVMSLYEKPQLPCQHWPAASR